MITSTQQWFKLLTKTNSTELFVANIYRRFCTAMIVGVVVVVAAAAAV